MFSGAGVFDRYPFGKSNVAVRIFTSRPGEIDSIEFSVLVSPPERKPASIFARPAAALKIMRDRLPAALAYSVIATTIHSCILQPVP